MKTSKPKTEEVVKKEPEVKFRSGAISASVWAQEVEVDKRGKVKFYTFNMQRAYKDKKDEWQHTTFRKNDLAAVEAVLRRVTDYLLINEDEEDKDFF
jgi:hypothetical protein